MKSWFLGGVSVAAMIAMPCAGWSLTAQEAWEKWQAAAESYGQTLSNDGEASMDGKLTVRGVSVSTEMDEASLSARIEEVVFAEQADGTVNITMSESFPLVVSGTDAETGEVFDITVTVEQPGMVMNASDAEDGTAFAYDAPSILARVTEFKIDDQPTPLTVEVALTGSAGMYSVGAGAGAPVTSAFESSELSVNVDVTDPEGSGTASVAVTVDGLTSDSLAVGIDEAETDDMAEMLAKGFAVEGAANYGAVSFDMDFTDGGDTFAAQGGLSGGGAEFAMSAEGLSYDVGYEGLEVSVSGSEIPLPQVSLRAAAASTAVSIPTLVSEVAEPFAFRTALEGLELGEEIWSLFDPAGVLPRTPATLIVDLAGSGRWMLDIFDEAAMTEMEMSGATPGEVEQLELKELKLSLGGADLSGEGAFTLDNSDLQTFGGVPRPEGKANFRLIGGNGLLENLTKMGIVPQEDVMMVRMMTGMLARPGAGPDELVSEVVIDGSGQLLINGAPLPF